MSRKQKTIHDDSLFIAPYIDSLVGAQLVLTKDGRRRGLWVWLENDLEIVQRHHELRYEEALAKMMKAIKKKRGKPNEGDMRCWLGVYFSVFSSEYDRQSNNGVRLTWRQARALAAKLNSSIKAEKHKTETFD